MPTSLIASPVQGSTQGLTVEVTGSAADNVDVSRVVLSIKNLDLQQNWNGSEFQAGEFRVEAYTTNDSQIWNYLFEPRVAGNYRIASFAIDAAGNIQNTYNGVIFKVGGFQSAGPGQWSAPVTMPSIPVSAANLPDGRVLTWAAYNQRSYAYGQDNAQTYTSIFDPATNTSELILVTDMQHDMFCPGANILSDGSVLINGGSSAARTSIYNPGQQSWTQAETMNIPRAYQANTMLADGSVLTLGGSWKDAGNNQAGNKTAEVWTEGQGWRVFNGIPADSMQTNDRDGAGKILTSGGSPHYENSTATSNAFSIAVNGNNVTTQRVSSMNYARVFHNSVVLPNGEVLVIGGQAAPIVFSDEVAVMVPELWNPITRTFRSLAQMQVPRTYHSVAILLPDGRVLAGGGRTSLHTSITKKYLS